MRAMRKDDEMEAYLDNSATTQVLDSVREVMVRTMLEDYGNPSALHLKGVEAERYVKDAGECLAKILKAEAKELFFTSGGTESNNLALIGAALANKRAGNRIITTAIEHPSVANTMKYLEEQGFELIVLPVDEYGRVKLETLKRTMTKETILVSVMYVNNEIGAVQPIEEINRIIREVNPQVVFHVDAVQAFGKFRIYPKKLGIDLLSVSGHKIHGPKGIGFLYKNTEVKLKPIVFGGGQQEGMRSGTLNVPGIAGMACAAKVCYEDFEEKQNYLYELREYFIDGIKQIEGTKINGCTDRNGAPHVVSVSFDGVRSEVLLHTLEDKGIYASAGSACSSHKVAVSATLKAIGLDKKYLDSTLRFSFSTMTTKEELQYTLEVLQTVLPTLRRFTRH